MRRRERKKNTMILTISSFDDVSPKRRVQEYNQIAYKVARAARVGEYRNVDEAIVIMTSRMHIDLSDDDYNEIKSIAVRIR